jgi:Ser/Thr protein kinase RdoA (MazF antagonist)
MQLDVILQQYGISTHCNIEIISTGLINATYKVTTANKEIFIVQKINDAVFKQPNFIADNILKISNYLKENKATYLFTVPLSLPNGQQMFVDEKKGYFRVFPFVKNSKTYTIVNSPSQAYEAAAQFGKFTAQCKDFNVSTLNFTIPDFHNLNLRYQQFEESLKNGNQKRIDESKIEINFLLQQKSIVKRYNTLIRNLNFKKRVTHHDTKISNVLFDDKDKGLCIIDLDTVMPGYFISDVGDMMRTYLCPVSEEEIDIGKIVIRKDYYKAIKDGYLSQMKDILTKEEKQYFHFSGAYMMYMQALRFLTDYLLDDVYYGAKYEKHNLNRAKNQVTLLQLYQTM